MAEIRPLTGLRGIAATSVFLAHLHKTLSEYGLPLDVPEWLRRLALNGGPQVDVFFVLSGFILAMNYRAWFATTLQPAPYGTFLRRRFARIYPLHFTILLLVMAVVAAAHLANLPTSHGLARFDPGQLPAYFLLMQAWGVFFPGDGDWNPPSWSISIEALAYLVFPLLIWATARWSARRPWLPVLCAILAGAVANHFIRWGLSGPEGIARGLSEFVLGCFAFALVETRFARWCQGNAGSLVAVALLVAGYLLTPDATFLVAVCCVPLLLALCRENAAGRFFGSMPVFFLGEVSYSIYLGHFLFSSLAYRIVRPSWMLTGEWQTAVGILFIVVFVVTLSTACYYLVEKPGRGLLSGRRKPATK